MIKQFIGFVRKMQLKTLKAFGSGLNDKDFRISICDNNLEIASILAKVFEGMQEVEVLHGNILKIWADAIVSPANSFGDMGGGLDKAIDDFYKRQAQQRVMNEIRENYLGELPVGKAITLKMDSMQFPYLIVAPTMRIPGKLHNSINAYLAMRAILVELIMQNKKGIKNLRHVAIPALCTGIGGMPYQEAADQMLTAYKNIMLSAWMDVKHPAMAPYAYSKKFD